MNGTTKFHRGRGPAFDPGEVWYSSEGFRVEVVRTWAFGTGKFDVVVEYLQANGTLCQKDVWNFQVRYTHQADLACKNKPK
jgi:hypothetical protein